MIAHDLLKTATARYEARPAERAATARTILVNAVRLAKAEIGTTATAELLDAAVAEPDMRGVR